MELLVDMLRLYFLVDKLSEFKLTSLLIGFHTYLAQLKS